MSTGKTVLILGDSWSQGEINTNENGKYVSHSGINQYLLDDGYKIENRGGERLLGMFKEGNEAMKKTYGEDLPWRLK